MRVVLPGESDPAVHLNVQFRVARVGRKRQCRSRSRRQPELLLVLGRGAGGVPHRSDARLAGHQHVRAVVLDRLERGDGPAKLLAHLGVLDGGVDAVRSSPDRLGGQQRPRPRQCRVVGSRQDVVVADADLLQADPSGAAGRIQVLRHLDGDAGAAALDHQHVVTGRDQQQVAESRAEHDAGVTVGHAVAQTDVAAQTDARGDGSVDQARAAAATSVRRSRLWRSPPRR